MAIAIAQTDATGLRWLCGLETMGAEVNRLCHESKFGPVDWEEFQGRLRPMLLEMLGDAVEYHIHKPGVAGEN